MACIQETKLERCETLDWNMIGRGFLESFLEINANRQSRGVTVTWNETVFTNVDARMGQFSVAVKLKRQSDDLEIVVVSIYGPTNAKRRGDLWA